MSHSLYLITSVTIAPDLSHRRSLAVSFTIKAEKMCVRNCAPRCAAAYEVIWPRASWAVFVSRRKDRSSESDLGTLLNGSSEEFHLNSINISVNAEFVVTLSSTVGRYIEMSGFILNGKVDRGLQSMNEDELTNLRPSMYCLDVVFLKAMIVVRKYKASFF